MSAIRPAATVLGAALLLATACARGDDAAQSTETATPAAIAAPAGGQASVQDDESQQDIVKVAAGSKDHTTLVAALKAADLVNSMANAGPFTVFAPTNAAFDKLPKGTVDDLLKPENKDKLTTILQHHVTVSALDSTSLVDGTKLGMVDGTSAAISKRGADTYIGDAKIVGAVRASNGMVYVVDGVLLPPTP